MGGGRWEVGREVRGWGREVRGWGEGGEGGGRVERGDV